MGGGGAIDHDKVICLMPALADPGLLFIGRVLLCVGLEIVRFVREPGEEIGRVLEPKEA